MTEQLCGDGCGEPAKRRGYSLRCYGRWHHHGFPEGGPPPPVSAAESGRRSGQARAPEADPYDLQWLAGAPERRIRRTRSAAADLVRCVAARDAAGVELLLHRVTDWHALAVVLAECADPARTAVVTRSATLASVDLPGTAADDAGHERSEAATVDEGDADAA